MTQRRQQAVRAWILQQIDTNISELENPPVHTSGYHDEVGDDVSDLQVVHGWSLHGSRVSDRQPDSLDGGQHDNSEQNNNDEQRDGDGDGDRDHGEQGSNVGQGDDNEQGDE